jgi:putative transposase
MNPRIFSWMRGCSKRWSLERADVRRECLDHLFILQEKQLDRDLHAYVQYFNRARPHQGMRQRLPEQYGEPVQPDHDEGPILSFPVLGGLHHEYRRSA